MSPTSDFPHEMSGELPLDDAIPASFAEEVRFAVSGSPPVPSMALAAALKAGISPSEKGDLLVTAVSNVNGPAPQVAGLPKWREETNMPITGVLAGLVAKVTGLGTAAKAAMAGVTAVATMGLAGGAAGVLPAPAQNLVASAVGAATPFDFPESGDVTGVVQRAVGSVPQATVPVTVPDVPGAPPVSVASSAKAGAAATPPPAPAKSTAPATAPATNGVTMPALPPMTVPPAVAGLVKGLPACVTNLIPTGGGVPDPAKLATQIPACIPQVLSTAGLPPEVAKCISTILGVIGGANGMSPSSVPSIASLNVSSCVPVDGSKCVSNMLGMLATIPGWSSSIPTFGSLPGMSSVTGCVPMNVTACITSITSAVSAGTTPKIDLSACMPATAPASGVPNVPGLGSLPGLGGALPFFGG